MEHAREIKAPRCAVQRRQCTLTAPALPPRVPIRACAGEFNDYAFGRDPIYTASEQFIQVR